MLHCLSFVVLETRQIVVILRTGTLNILLFIFKGLPLRCFDYSLKVTLMLMGETVCCLLVDSPKLSFVIYA